MTAVGKILIRINLASGGAAYIAAEGAEIEAEQQKRIFSLSRPAI
jgi:hypothetical protein